MKEKNQTINLMKNLLTQTKDKRKKSNYFEKKFNQSKKINRFILFDISNI